jgi:hypothetical protein
MLMGKEGGGYGVGKGSSGSKGSVKEHGVDRTDDVLDVIIIVCHQSRPPQSLFFRHFFGYRKMVEALRLNSPQKNVLFT